MNSAGKEPESGQASATPALPADEVHVTVLETDNIVVALEDNVDQPRAQEADAVETPQKDPSPPPAPGAHIRLAAYEDMNLSELFGSNQEFNLRTLFCNACLILTTIILASVPLSFGAAVFSQLPPIWAISLDPSMLTFTLSALSLIVFGSAAGFENVAFVEVKLSKVVMPTFVYSCLPLAALYLLPAIVSGGSLPFWAYVLILIFGSVPFLFGLYAPALMGHALLDSHPLNPFALRRAIKSAKADNDEGSIKVLTGLSQDMEMCDQGVQFLSLYVVVDGAVLAKHMPPWTEIWRPYMLALVFFAANKMANKGMKRFPTMQVYGMWHQSSQIAVAKVFTLGKLQSWPAALQLVIMSIVGWCFRVVVAFYGHKLAARGGRVGMVFKKLTWQQKEELIDSATGQPVTKKGLVLYHELARSTCEAILFAMVGTLYGLCQISNGSGSWLSTGIIEHMFFPTSNSAIFALAMFTTALLKVWVTQNICLMSTGYDFGGMLCRPFSKGNLTWHRVIYTKVFVLWLIITYAQMEMYDP